MVTQLRVVNDCLAVMGEAPLNSLTEEHEYKGAILSKLDSIGNRIQNNKGNGWWYNREALTLSVNPTDSRIYLPGDVASFLIYSERPKLVRRGKVLYNVDTGTDIFPAGTSYQAVIVRMLPLESVPDSVAEFIAASVLLSFQNDYDGDQTKTRNLSADVAMREVDANSEHTRNRKVNLLDSNYRLARLRNVIRQARYPLY